MESMPRWVVPHDRPGVAAVQTALVTGRTSPLAKTVLLVVLDTNVLLRDIRARLRYRQHTFLQQAAGFGTFKLFATERVRSEVTSHLREYIEKYRLDAGLAEKVWATEYGRLIQFVVVPDTHPDPRVSIVASLHKADVPTAVLAAMLAPCLVLSTDKSSLGKAGLAAIEWFPLARHAAIAIPDGDAVLVGTELILKGSLASVWGLGKGIFSLFKTRPDIAVLVGLGLAFIIDQARHSERVREILADVRERAMAAGGSAAAKMETHRAAVRGLSGSEVRPGQDRPLLDHVVRTLALGGQMSRTKVAETLRHRGLGSGRNFPLLIDSVLREYPAFLPVPGRGWELGRRACETGRPGPQSGTTPGGRGPEWRCHG
jgi:predicted nucleic acid-binding protein